MKQERARERGWLTDDSEQWIETGGEDGLTLLCACERNRVGFVCMEHKDAYILGSYDETRR